MAVDAAANLYIADSGNNAIRKVDAVTQIITTIATSEPQANYASQNVAVDAAGNVYFDDWGTSTIRKLSPTASLSFTTGVGLHGAEQTVTASNIGNTSLNLTSVATTTANFGVDSSSPCLTVSQLAAGASCAVDVYFAPTSPGNFSDNLVFTDNALNVSGSVQNATLSGLGVFLPKVVTLSAPANVTTAAVTLKGAVDAFGLAASYWFEYGTAETLTKTSQTPHQNLPAGTGETAVSAVLTGLLPHTDYYYRAAGQSSVGTSRGQVLAFRSGGAHESGTDAALTIATTGTGTGAVMPAPLGDTCGPGCYTYKLGTAVTLTATAGTGSTFANWAGVCTGSAPSCGLTMKMNQSVIATFNPAATLTLTTATVGNGSGTVTSTLAGSSCGAGCSAYSSGSVVTLTANPGSGSVFAGWAGACSNSTGSCTVTMTSSQSVTATFVLKTFNLTIFYAGTGTGSVVPNPIGSNCGTNCYTYNWGDSG